MLALIAGCGGGSGTVTRQSKGGPVVKETKAEGQIGNVVPPGAIDPGQTPDPDSENMGGADANTVVTAVGKDRYELVIENTSRVGYIDAILWQPPAGATIESVVEQAGWEPRGHRRPDLVQRPSSQATQVSLPPGRVRNRDLHHAAASGTPREGAPVRRVREQRPRDPQHDAHPEQHPVDARNVRCGQHLIEGPGSKC